MHTKARKSDNFSGWYQVSCVGWVPSGQRRRATLLIVCTAMRRSAHSASEHGRYTLRFCFKVRVMMSWQIPKGARRTGIRVGTGRMKKDKTTDLLPPRGCPFEMQAI